MSILLNTLIDDKNKHPISQSHCEIKIYNPNAFFNGSEKVVIKPTFPLPANTLSACIHSIYKQANKDDYLFKYVGFNNINSLLGYFIVNGNLDFVEKMFLNNKDGYLNKNIHFFSPNGNYLGKPLDLSVNSLTNHKNIDILLFLLSVNARSDEELFLIKKLETKATISNDDSFSFRLFLCANILKVFNKIYDEDYIEKLLSREKLSLIYKEGSEENIDNILMNLDKLSQEKKDLLEKQVKENKQFEEKFIKEKLSYLFLLDDYKLDKKLVDKFKNSPTNTFYYSLLNDPTILHDPTFIFHPLNKKNNYDVITAELKGMLNEAFEKTEDNLSEYLTLEILKNNEFNKFLIFQSLLDMRKREEYKKEFISLENQNTNFSPFSNEGVLLDKYFYMDNNFINKIKSYQILNKDMRKSIGIDLKLLELKPIYIYSEDILGKRAEKYRENYLNNEYIKSIQKNLNLEKDDFNFICKKNKNNNDEIKEKNEEEREKDNYQIFKNKFKKFLFN